MKKLLSNDLLLFTVTHNNTDKCIDMIKSINGWNLFDKLVIVDNGSSDREFYKLENFIRS